MLLQVIWKPRQFSKYLTRLVGTYILQIEVSGSLQTTWTSSQFRSSQGSFLTA